jgi:hypothetical protein
LLLQLTNVPLFDCDITVQVVVVPVHVIQLSGFVSTNIVFIFAALGVLLHLVALLNLIFLLGSEESLVLANAEFFLALSLCELKLFLLFFAELHGLLAALTHELLIEELDLGAEGRNLLDKLHVFQHNVVVVLFVGSLARLELLGERGDGVLLILLLLVHLLLNVAINFHIGGHLVLNVFVETLVGGAAEQFRVHLILEHPVDSILVATDVDLILANGCSGSFD